MVSGSLPQNWQDRERARLQKVEEHVVDEGRNSTTKPVGTLVGGYFSSTATTFTDGAFVPLTFDSAGRLKTDAVLNASSVSVSVDLEATEDSIAVYGAEGGVVKVMPLVTRATVTTVPVSLVDSSGAQITTFGGDAEQTPGVTAVSKVVQLGGITNTTVPTQRANGDAVAQWFNEFGQQVIYGANLSVNGIDVNVVNQALLNTVSVVLLNAVTTVGASATIDASNYNKLTFYIVGTSVTGNANISFQTSYAGSSWAEMTNIAMATSETQYVVVSDEKHKFIRANINSVGTSGTFTVNLFGGN